MKIVVLKQIWHLFLTQVYAFD